MNRRQRSKRRVPKWLAKTRYSQGPMWFSLRSGTLTFDATGSELEERLRTSSGFGFGSPTNTARSEET